MKCMYVERRAYVIVFFQLSYRVWETVVTKFNDDFFQIKNVKLRFDT